MCDEYLTPAPRPLSLVPLTQARAKEFVQRFHRHHKPPLGSVFQVGCAVDGELVGVVIVGRPVARMLQDGATAEVTRLCTDGSRNACSMLYGAARRAAKALGYRRLYTYTLPTEGGVSLKASGWICEGPAGGGAWSRIARPRDDEHPTDVKWRWRADL